MYLAHLSVVALPSEGASVGRFVRKAVELVRLSGLHHEVHAMGTEIQSPRLDQIFELIRRIDEALGAMGAQRVTFSVKIDHRRDKEADLRSKVRSAVS